MRATADANILVRAIASPSGPGGALLDLLTAPPHVLVVSPYILGEVRRVLAYPRVRKLLRMTDEEIAEFLALIAVCAEVVEPRDVPMICRDPMDDAVIATAVEGRADVLCTLDRDLHEPIVAAYLATFGIRVLTDVALLQELRRENPASQPPGNP
jgi:putative PIN family toxin of toxin-antitoxin system